LSEVTATRELLAALGSCYFDANLNQTNSAGDDTNKMLGAEGLYTFFTDNNLWDQPETYVINVLKAHGHLADVEWYFKAKKTEAFVRFAGKVITMGQYQVFNPITGTHTYCETLADAKVVMAEVATQLLANTSRITICQEISNENGDTTWVPTEIPNAFTITPTT